MWLLALVVAAATAVSACSGASAGAPGSASGSGSDKRLVVLAASSLAVPFEALERRFEQTRPGVDVVVSYGSSTTLATQIASGFPADVFAAAGEAAMAPVVAAGDNATPPRAFARNYVAVAVPPGNPGRLRSLADLARPDVTVAVCQPEAPCGMAAQQLIAGAGMDVRPTTFEPDVRAVLGKVQLGEVDAGVVYASDVASAHGAVTGIAVPARFGVELAYPIVRLRAAPQPQLADDFVASVLSPAGQRELRAAGFQGTGTAR